ncbi:MAG: DUF2461 domain-containing protein [Bacteroidales bacterium]|nr:DUF2461 domain-containing protein [Bacteroidales bacterium]
MEQILHFLSVLKDNNNRDWFQKNSERYQEALESFSQLVRGILTGIAGFDPAIMGLDEKDTIFRIYKDIRFSKDKTPYKSHFGAYIAKGGRKSKDAGYYFHIEPGGSFIAAGIFMPDSEHLKAVRQEIMFRPGAFMEITEDALSKGFTRGGAEDKLKLVPKGFPTDFKYADELKFKHYIFMREYRDDQVLSGTFPDMVVKDFRELFPFVSFLNTAIDFKGNE